MKNSIAYKRGIIEACNLFKQLIKDEDRLISFVAQKRMLDRINQLLEKQEQHEEK